MSSCSDILVSFLSDIGDDFVENFQFLDAEIDVSSFLDSSGPQKSKRLMDSSSSLSIASEMSEGSSSSSPVYSSVSACSDTESVHSEGVSEENDSTCRGANEITTQWNSNIVKRELSELSSGENSGIDYENEVWGNKRKAPQLTISEKKTKQTPEQKLVAVVHMLKRVKSRRASGLYTGSFGHSSSQLQRHSDPVGATEKFLSYVLCSKSTNHQDLIKVCSTSAVFQCKALSSLHHFAQAQRSQLNLCAWMPVHSSLQTYPEKHSGIGQISGANRVFMSSIDDLLPTSLTSKISFSLSIDQTSVVVSATYDQVTAQFTWRSVGLTALGYAHEIEFTGLIRSSFCKDGICSAWISFDSCQIVRLCKSISGIA